MKPRMNTRHLIRTALAGVFLAAMPLAANAVVSTPAPTATPAAAAQAQRLNNLKTKGTAEIDRRLAALNAALEKLNAATKLAAADKTALTQQIQAEIAGLTKLKTKLAADADLATARADVASIVTDYRVYALVAPKVRLVAAIDRLTVAADKLSALQAQLRVKADAANKSAASGVSAEQQKVDDMAKQITAAKAAIDGLNTKLIALQPTDYNANHAVLVDYRAKTKAAFTDLKAARDDAKAVIDALKTAKK
jgi:valyl-tRNA synthetase